MEQNIKIIEIGHIVGFAYSVSLKIEKELFVIPSIISDSENIIIKGDEKFVKILNNMTSEKRTQIFDEIVDKIINKICKNITMHSLILSFNSCLPKKEYNIVKILDILNEEIVENLDYMIEQKVVPDTENVRKIIVGKCMDIAKVEIEKGINFSDRYEAFNKMKKKFEE